MHAQHAPPTGIARRHGDVEEGFHRPPARNLFSLLQPQRNDLAGVVAPLKSTDTRVVDEDVEPRCELPDLNEHGANRARIRYVGSDGMATDLGHRLPRCLQVQVVDEDACTFLREAAGDLSADPTRGTCDECGLAL